MVQEKSVKCQQINSKILWVFLLGDSLQNKLICTVRVRRCEFASVAGSTAHKILQRVNNSHISRLNLNLGQQKYFSPIGKSVLCSRPCLHHHAGLSTLQVLNLSSLNKHIVKVSLTGFSVHLLLIPPSLVQHVHFSLLGHVVNCSPEYCYRFSFSSQSMTTTLRWTFRL